MNTVKKRLLNLGFLGLVGASLGLYSYYGVFKTQQAEEQKKSEQEKIVTFKKEDIVEVLIHQKDTQIRVRKEGEGETAWKMLEPLPSTADKSAIESIVQYFADLKKKKSLNSTQAASSFGIDDKSSFISFTDKNQKETTLILGMNNSFDDSLYLQKKGDSQIALVPGNTSAQINKDTFALREKRLLIFEDEKLSQIEYQTQDLHYILQMQGLDWFIKTPIETTADKTQINTLISGLHAAVAKKFESEDYIKEQVPLERVGLDKPASTLILTINNNKIKVFLSSDKQGHFYAKHESSKQIYELSESLAKKFDLTINDLRDRAITKFNKEDIKQIKIEETGKIPLVFKLVSTTTDHKPNTTNEIWQLESAPKRSVIESKISNLLFKLSTAKAKSVIADKPSDQDKAAYELLPVKKTLTLLDQNGQTVDQLAIGKSSDGFMYLLSHKQTRLDSIDREQLINLNFEPDFYLEQESNTPHKTSSEPAQH